MSLVEILRTKDSGGLPLCEERHLLAMLRECEAQYVGTMPIQAKQAAEAIHRELDRRTQEERHTNLIAEQKHIQSALATLVTSQESVKASVDRLQDARRIDKLILIATIAGVAVGLAGILAAWILASKG